MDGGPAAAPPGDLVARAFGLGAVREPPGYAARGEMGVVWRLVTDAGAWAVKVLVEPVDATTGEDAAFQLALHAGGFPLPRPCLAAGGRAVIVGAGGAGYRVYEWVDLDPGGRVDRATAGGLLARIHGLAWPAGHVHPWFHRPVADDRWPALLDAARAAGAPWHDLLAGRVGEILATTARVAPGPPTGVVRCHLDFNAENVLTGTDGRPWVIDWENSGGADPAQELVQVVHELAGDDDRAARALLDGYRAAGGAVGPVLAAGLGAFSLAWAVQANLIALYAERALDAGRRPVDRDRSARWLPTILDHLLTVARAERILDLCAAR